MLGGNGLRSLFGIGPRSPTLSELTFPSGVIEPQAVPYFAHVLSAGYFSDAARLRASGMETCFSRMLALTSPRKHYGLMRDIKSLLVPGVGILRLEDSEDAFAFPAGALQEFFVKAGCGHIDSPQRFTIQLLAGSTLYTDMLPPHLKHVPSLGRLLRVAQLLADYDPRKQPEGSARWEATAEELAARLRELFIVGKSGTVDFAIHQEDADLILADLGPADSTVDPRAFMAELQGTICRSLKHYRAQRDWSQRSTLDECALTPEAVRDAKKREQSAVEAAAKQAAELVIAKKHYPAPLIHGFIVTTSGEEV